MPISIADKIVAKEGDYIFSLKGNQGSLSEDVDFYFKSKVSAKNIISCVAYDKGHGRLETRECFVFNDAKWLRDRHPNWKTIHSVIKINLHESSKILKKQHGKRDIIFHLLKTQRPMLYCRRFGEHFVIENSLIGF